MKSQIFTGNIYHRRERPAKHSFSYPTGCLLCDIAELGDGRFGTFLLSNNHWNLFSVYDSDLLPGAGSVLEKFRALEKHHAKGASSRIYVLTMPRVLGYVFNPVNFYFAEDQSSELCWALAEVSNTFGEKHLYPLEITRTTEGWTCSFPKVFYVSPFLPVSGSYSVSISYDESYLSVQVDLQENGESEFSAAIRGRRVPLSSLSLLQFTPRLVCNALLAMSRIHLHALFLILKNVTPFFKSVPLEEGEAKRSRSLWYEGRRYVVCRLARKSEDLKT